MSEFSKLCFWFLSKILKSTSLRISMHTEQWDVTCSLTCHVGFAAFWNQKREKLPIPVLGQTATQFQESLEQRSQCCMSKVAWQNHPQVLQDTNFQMENICWKSLVSQNSDFPKLKLLKVILFETISSWLLSTSLNFSRGDWKRKMLSSVRQHVHLR